MSAAAFRPLIVTYRGGRAVRLDELGDVIDSVENNKVAGWYNDTRSISLMVQRQPGTNTVEVVDRIKELLTTSEDLDQVVHQHQLHGSADVDRFIAVLGQQNNHQRQVPAVLSVVLQTVGAGQW